MTMYKPVPELSEEQKRAIRLLAKLLLESFDPAANVSNTSPGLAALSYSETAELIELMNNIARSRGFLLASSFVEGFVQPAPADPKRLREIYLSERKRRGKSRAVASWTWGRFQARLGILIDPVSGAYAEEMPFEYFKKMEEMLLGSIGLNYKVIDYIIGMISAQQAVVERLKNRKAHLLPSSIRQVLEGVATQWSKRGIQEISTTRIAATITLIADTSVMFTTRDWGVAGTISTMAGAASVVITG